MATSYQIITDSSCDLPQELADRYGLIVLPLSLTVDDKTYHNYLDGREIGFHELYEKFRSGSKTSTCAVNPEAFIQVMEPCLREGHDVFYIGFSSGLSTTYQSGVIAAAELREKYPERRIMTIDSLCASLGQGLFVHYAVKKQREGASMDELMVYLEELRSHLCHWFTVDDLMYLKRGGRISASTALLGTALQIKPVMHTDDDGKLANVSKARGRKASIRALPISWASWAAITTTARCSSATATASRTPNTLPRSSVSASAFRTSSSTSPALSSARTPAPARWRSSSSAPSAERPLLEILCRASSEARHILLSEG